MKLVHEVNDLEFAISNELKFFVCSHCQIEEMMFQASIEKLFEDKDQHDLFQSQIS